MEIESPGFLRTAKNLLHNQFLPQKLLVHFTNNYKEMESNTELNVKY